MSKNILHISDLHLELFKTKEKQIKSRFNETNFELKFIDRIKESRDKIDYIFLTGDLSNSGNSEEYDLVTSFINRLSKEFSVERKNIVICPGNHDVNWVNNRIAFTESVLKALTSGKIEPKESDAFGFHEEKFKDFKTFYDTFYSDTGITFNPTASLFREISLDIDGLNIQLCCLNSCYKESFSDSSHYGFIHYEDLAKSLKNESLSRMALLHHIPIVLNRSEERRVGK